MKRKNLDRLLGESLGYDWRAVFYDPAGELYRSLNPAPSYSYQPGSTAQTNYWSSRRPAGVSPTVAAQLAAAQSLRDSTMQRLLAQRQAAVQQAALLAPPPPPQIVPPPMPTTYAPDYSTPDEGAAPMSDPIIGMAVNALLRPTQKTALAARTAGFVKKAAPVTGRTYLALRVNRAAPHDHQKTIQNARMAGAHAIQTGQRIQATLARAVIKARTAAVHGLVAPGAKRSIVSRAVHAAQLQKAASLAIQHGKKALKGADNHQSLITNNAAKVRAGTVTARAVTKLHGLAMVLGIDPAPMPDPTNPGFLTDGSPDPSGGYADTSSAAGPPNFGLTPPTAQDAAPVAGVDFMPGPDPAADTQFYDCPTDDSLPLGAIIFTGQQQPPFQGLGNYTVFYGVVPGAAPPKGGPKSGYSLHNDGWWLELMGTQPSQGYSGNHNFDHVDNPDNGMVFESQKNSWGPLIGNPQGWTRGLRFSPSGPSGNRWFWYYDQAPPIVQQPILMARQAQMMLEYQASLAAAAAEYAAQMAQEKLDAADAQAVAKQQAAADAASTNTQNQIDLQQQALDATERGQMLSYRQQQLEAMKQGGGFGGFGGGGFYGGGGGGYGDGGGYAADDGGGYAADDPDAGVDWGDDDQGSDDSEDVMGRR